MNGKEPAVSVWRRGITSSGLPPTSRLVALTLSLHMRADGTSGHPGSSRLAADTGLSVRAVKEHLASLVASGWLSLVERGGQPGSRRMASEYACAYPQPVQERAGYTGAPVQEDAVTGAYERVNGCTTFTPSREDLDTDLAAAVVDSRFMSEQERSEGSNRADSLRHARRAAAAKARATA